MTYRPDPQDAFAADELAAYQEFMDDLTGGYGEDGDYADYDEYCDDMDGDWDSAMESAGWGTDDDYGFYGYEEDF